MPFTGEGFYAEVTIDGKFNFVDHVTGRIIEQANIQDVELSFDKHKQIELDKVAITPV